jgi:hypothetical protein
MVITIASQATLYLFCNFFREPPNTNKRLGTA